MQDSINKNLEELKNKHTETNNTITEIKYTLEGISSRISEVEGRYSELEDKMVEMSSEEQNKVKIMKRTGQSQGLLGQYKMHQHVHYRDPHKEKAKRKDQRKYLK